MKILIQPKKWRKKCYPVLTCYRLRAPHSLRSTTSSVLRHVVATIWKSTPPFYTFTVELSISNSPILLLSDYFYFLTRLVANLTFTLSLKPQVYVGDILELAGFKMFSRKLIKLKGVYEFLDIKNAPKLAI